MKRSFKLIILFVIATAGILGDHSAFAQTTYSWTGTVDGDWTNVGNWDTNGVPPPGGGDVGLLSGDQIVFNATNSINPLPTSSIPSMVARSGSYKTPSFEVLYGGPVSGSITFGGSGLHWGYTQTTTVGDGDTGNGTVTLIYSAMYSFNHDPNSVKTWVINSDGTLNFIKSATYDMAGSTARPSVFTVNGGTLSFNGAMKDFTTYTQAYIEFTAAGGSFTAKFGENLPDMTTLEANIGDGLSIRPSGPFASEMALTAVDHGDNTFTVSSSLPLKVVLSNSEVQSSDPSGTTVGSLTMREGGSLQTGYTFSIVPTNDYAAFAINGTGTNLVTAADMTNGFYEITLRGTNSVSGSFADTSYVIDAVFPDVAYTNEWTGAADGNWANPYNWRYRRVPPYTSPTTVGVVSGSRIRFNAVGSPNPLPTSNIPYLDHKKCPPVDLLYGGELTLALATTENWTYDPQMATVGDGDVGNGTVTLNYGSMAALARDPNGTRNWRANADGTLNFTRSGTFVLSYGSPKYTTLTIAGGSVTFNGALQSFATVTQNYSEFTAIGSLFTATFGGDFPDVAAVEAQIGEGLSFRSTTGKDVEVRDNGDGTFSVGFLGYATPTVFIVR